MQMISRPLFRAGFRTATAFCLAAAACTGAINGDDTGSEKGDPTREQVPVGTTPPKASPDGTAPGAIDPVTGKPTPPTNGNPTLPTTTPDGKPVITTPDGKPIPGDPLAAGTRPLRRLTRREYNNTVRDLLGDATKPADAFPSDADDSFRFKRSGLVASQDASVLRASAESLAAAVAQNPKAHLPCDPTAGEAACAQKFVATFGLRAFRRPLHPDETTRLTALYESARSTQKLEFNDSIGLLVEAILQSPGFLYHWEQAPGAVAREGQAIRLDHYDMASRLSYFLWGTMPDKDLFTAASAGKLGTTAEVEAQARRMLMDAKAKETLTVFFEDWLDLDVLNEKTKDSKIYPEWNDALKTAMGAETRAFVASVLFDGDGKFNSALTSTSSFVNQALGTLYGMQKVSGTAMQKTELNPLQRKGFLTHGSFLALTGATDGSHPIKRGHSLYERMLCRHLPPPPNDVPPAKPASAGGTTRDRLAEHGRIECARACHALIDPLGFAFESYDGIGKFRTTDNKLPVDASGTVTLDGKDLKYSNAIDFIGHLAKSDEVGRCVTAQWMEMGLGRDISEADTASLNQSAAAYARTDSSLRDMLVAFTTSRTFRYRSPAAGEVLP